MEANAFIAEVYRRMSVRSKMLGTSLPGGKSITKMQAEPTVKQSVFHYKPLLPDNKNAIILDIGFGEGWFIAATLQLGYNHIEGADFGAADKQGLRSWSDKVKHIHNITTSIGDFLSTKKKYYDVIHMSHVIEHIPKYYLLDTVDAFFNALKENGRLILRTPNMEAPCALSCLYVTLGHEYGFCGSNLKSLMHLGGFDNIQLHRLKQYQPTLKQKIGSVLRWPFLKYQMIKHRLFGVNYGGIFEPELVIFGDRKDFPGFNEKL